MNLDYHILDRLRRDHPAWRLLCAQHAPMVAAFLHRVFITPNVRSLSQSELCEALEDELFVLREHLGDNAFPGTAQGYLNDWADNDKGWLRKFYPPGSDEPHFDLTPATEKALAWLESLTARSFVGTESRLLTLFALLRQISEGSQRDPRARLAELRRKRDEIDAEIARVEAGDIPVLDDTSIKDRFQQFLQLARGLLADFREVEHNFRTLDRRVRERIARWQGSKGELLDGIMNERDAIADSDQGRSFRAFWDFLMSQSRQEELTRLLEEVLAMPAVREMRPDPRLRRVHYDWLEAGEHTQRTVARLSEQLRRFLDDRTWLENRRIMDILRSIEARALEVRSAPPAGAFTTIDEAAAALDLPLERPLYRPPFRPVVTGDALDAGDAEVDTSALYDQVAIDREELRANIRRELDRRGRTTLAEVVAGHPLRHGLAELVAYLRLAADWPGATMDEDREEEVSWRGDNGVIRRARLPRIIFLPDG